MHSLDHCRKREWRRSSRIAAPFKTELVPGNAERPRDNPEQRLPPAPELRALHGGGRSVGVGIGSRACGGLKTSSMLRRAARPMRARVDRAGGRHRRGHSLTRRRRVKTRLFAIALALTL